MNQNLIKEKLAQLQKKGSKSSDKIWKPKPGKTQIRIIPYKHDVDNPFRELYFHYDVTKKTVLSPKTFGEPDPIDEFALDIRSDGTKESYFLSRKIEPKMRTYVPVLVRGAEAEGVKFWGFGKGIYEELLKVIDDPDYGDITDPKTGRDLTIEFEAAKGEGTFPETTFRTKPDRSPMTQDKDVIESIRTMPKVEDLFETMSYDDLKAALEKWLSNTPTEAEKATPSSDTEETTVSEPELTSAAGTVMTPRSLTEIDEQFDDLFND